MSYKRATLVPLGKGHISKVTGLPEPMGKIIEARVLDRDQFVYDQFRFTRMADFRIAIEREFPLANEEEKNGD